MFPMLLAFVGLAPVVAQAACRRWHDDSGGFDHSNIPSRVAAHAAEVRTDVGYLARAAVDESVPKAPPHRLRSLERLREERALRDA